MRSLLIYGGTFDPPHIGHIQTAVNVQKNFNFDKFIFLPCKIPVIKQQTVASPTQRIEMLKLATQDHIDFIIDTREINRETPSYMVETLIHFRREYGNNIPITLLIGEDAFYGLHNWYRWKELILLCNMLVIKRANYYETNTPNELQNMIKKHATKSKDAILQLSHGNIYLFNAGAFTVSSSIIRNSILNNNLDKDMLPANVYKYIQSENIYR